MSNKLLQVVAIAFLTMILAFYAYQPEVKEDVMVEWVDISAAGATKVIMETAVDMELSKVENETNTVTSPIEPEEPVEEIVEEVVPEPEPEPEPQPEIILTEEEVKLIALVAMGEAEGESEYGIRLVIDVILNRIEHPKQPNTVKEVIYAPEQFAVMWNDRLEDCYVSEYYCQLVREEAMSRTNYDVIFFRMNRYHSFGTPLFQEGCHYFSSY